MRLPISLERIDATGGAWTRNFRRTWSDYERWYLCEGPSIRPGYQTCLDAILDYMPELEPIYRMVCDWAGGGDLTSRFLSLYHPPPYMAGCTQAVWDAPQGAIMLRNYDYAPHWFEGKVFATDWLRPVMGVSDCAWGLLDGMNDAGLVASLTFGGSRETGIGFGIPLLVRYILETCTNVEQAEAVATRIPVQMAYNLTLLDRAGDRRVLHLKAGGGVSSHPPAVCANHQSEVVWPEFEAITCSRERQSFLEGQLLRPDLTQAALTALFLQPPLYQSHYERRFGTLYTSTWDPHSGSLALDWPGSRLTTTLVDFHPQKHLVHLGPIPPHA